MRFFYDILSLCLEMFFSGLATFVFDVVGWVNTSAVIALSNVDFFFAARNFDVEVSLVMMTMGFLDVGASIGVMTVCVVVCVTKASMFR